MRKIKTKILLGLAIITSISFFACEEEAGNDYQLSHWGDDESHYTGRNCMNSMTLPGLAKAGSPWQVQLLARIKKQP
jgi:hypothetical protein